MKSSKKIILASGSPRRRELLKGLDLEFVVDTKNNFDEAKDKSALSLSHEKIPVYLSQKKSHGFHRELADNEIIITSDTLVLCHSKDDPEDWEHGEVLGKPKDREDAFQMLKKLSNNVHKVITAVTIRDNFHEESFSDTALVYFSEILDEDIYHYIDKYKPFDKAGAYGIQEWIGYSHIEKIVGSFYTVMGFPISKIYQKLRQLGCFCKE